MTGDITAARVRALIDGSGLTQEQFATKAGMDPTKMSKSLNGKRRFTSLDLARISKLGGRSVDWLLGVDTPTPSLAARLDATIDAGSGARAAVEEATRIAQLRRDLAFLGYTNKKKVSVSPSSSSLWYEQGDDLATQALDLVRGHNRESTEPNLVDTIEDVFGIDVRVAEMPAGFDGLAWSDDECQLIVVSTSENLARQRFTLAHELCHLLAGDDQKLHIDENVMDPDRRRTPSEVRANAFAASFLMPATLLRDRVDGPLTEEKFAILVRDLSVSPGTLAWRLYNFGLVAEEQCHEFKRLTTAACLGLSGSTEILAERLELSQSPRLPGHLLRDALQAYLDGKATLNPLANLIGARVEDLRDAIETPSSLGQEWSSEFAS